MNRLVVRYRSVEAPISWLVDDERGRVMHGPHSGPNVPAEYVANTREVVVLVPGELVGVGEAKVAARSREQFARAIPYALEDALAEPVETLAFAWAAAGDGQLVAWMRRDQLAAIIADLKSRGLVADTLIPETLAVPAQADAVTLLLELDRALVRMGPARAVTLTRDELAAFALRIETPRDDQGRLVADVLDATGRADVPLLSHGERHIERGHALTFLARGARGALPSFATGAFASRQRGAGVLRWWRLAALLAGAAVLVGFGALVMEWMMLGRRAEALEVEMTSIYREAFPNATRIFDPRGQLESELRRAGGASSDIGALPLLARVAPVLTNTPQYTLEGVEYRSGTLELTVRAPAVDSLDRLREGVATVPDLTVALVNATTSGEGAEGVLRISATRGSATGDGSNSRAPNTNASVRAPRAATFAEARS